MHLVNSALELFRVNLLALSTHTVFAEIMTFNEKHDESIKLFMTVDYTDQLARVPLSKYLLRVSETVS